MMTPLVIMLGNVFYNHLRWAVPHPLPLDVRVETEGTVVRAATFGLHPDRLARVILILRENRRQVREINREGVQERGGGLLPSANRPSLAHDIALAIQ